MTAAAGFLLAAGLQHHFNSWLFFATLVGTSLIIASACVCNNYVDRKLDTQMARTNMRALALGTISKHAALLYACFLGVAGFAIIIVYVNNLVAIIGLVAFIDYVVLYGLSKRRSVHGTLVGSISGAAPIVAGYAAVTGSLDLGALLLFVILVAWQMAHFYAIALYRATDYKRANIPVLPVKRGEQETKKHIQAYILLFIAANILLTTNRYTSSTYAVAMTLIGLVWLDRSRRENSDATVWGRQLFLFSLLIIMILSLLLAVGHLLP